MTIFGKKKYKYIYIYIYVYGSMSSAKHGLPVLVLLRLARLTGPCRPWALAGVKFVVLTQHMSHATALFEPMSEVAATAALQDLIEIVAGANS
jgi:hypothetical protein